jgi:hypothetical protein
MANKNCDGNFNGGGGGGEGGESDGKHNDDGGGNGSNCYSEGNYGDLASKGCRIGPL